MTGRRSRTLPEALDARRESLDTGAGGRVSYYVDDRKDGRPLLLLHSINAAPTAIEVQPLFDHYREQRPVYALELPGFGFSERSDIDYTPDLYANTLNEFAGKVFGEAVDVVALSTTSEFVARAAVRAPQRFTSLVLVSPTGLGDRAPPSGAASDRLRKLFGVPLLSDGLYRALTSRASIRYFLKLSFEDRPPVEMIDQAWASARQPGAQYAPFCFLAMRLFTRDACETLYRRLTVPTLVLYDKDPNINFAQLPKLLENNARVSEARIAPTCGLPHWEEPDRTFAAIDGFWRAIGEEEGGS